MNSYTHNLWKNCGNTKKQANINEASGASAFIDAGLAKAVGWPIDVTDRFLGRFNIPGTGSGDPFGGSNSIRRGMNRINRLGARIGMREGDIPTRAPETRAERIGYFTGQAAGSVVPVGGALNVVGRSAHAVRGIQGGANALQRGGVAVAQNPYVRATVQSRPAQATLRGGKKLLRGLDIIGRGTTNPLNMFQNMGRINTTGRLGFTKRPLAAMQRLANKAQGLTGWKNYAANYASRLFSPASIFSSVIPSYNNMGALESYYDESMPRWQRAALAIPNYAVNALVTNPYVAYPTDMVINSLRRDLFQRNDLERSIPVPFRSEQDQIENTFTRDHYGLRGDSGLGMPLPFGYTALASRYQGRPTPVAEGETPYGTSQDIRNITQHNGRTLKEFPLFDFEGQPLQTVDGDTISNLSLAGLHNKQITRDENFQNSLWGRFLAFLAKVFQQRQTSPTSATLLPDVH